MKSWVNKLLGSDRHGFDVDEKQAVRVVAVLVVGSLIILAALTYKIAEAPEVLALFPCAFVLLLLAVTVWSMRVHNNKNKYE